MNVELRPIWYDEDLLADMVREGIDGDGRFLQRLRDEWLSGQIRFDHPGELLLGAFVDGHIVGVGGISRDPYEPQEGLGRLRHVYVMKHWRCGGFGRKLVQRLVECARADFEVLRLSLPKAGNAHAARMYESLGFIPSAHGRETHRLVFQTSSTSRP